MTAHIVMHTKGYRRRLRDEEVLDRIEVASMVNAIEHGHGQLWQRVAEGKRRD